MSNRIAQMDRLVGKEKSRSYDFFYIIYNVLFFSD